ncbi:MAG: radical SAM protein [Anaerolineae bacterium]|nr:radical SAM protein [Anaerolineae bacterium]
MPVELIDLQMDVGIGTTQASAQAAYQRVSEHLRAQGDGIAWVGISQTASSDNGLPLARAIHVALPDLPIILGGYFASAAYRRLLQDYPFLTGIVRGDGETAALEISRRLATGQPFPSQQIPGLAWLEGDRICTTPSKKAADALGPLDFGSLRNVGLYQLAYLMTSRGCPFRCNYCLENYMRSYTEYPPAIVGRQLDHLSATLHTDKILIVDPVFGLGRGRTLELCQLMRGRGFTYALESRVDVLAPDLIPILREAGVEHIYWGVESASAGTLMRMNKVRSQAEADRYVKRALEVLKACFQNEITAQVGIMLGFPGDTEEDHEASLRFVQQMESLYNQIGGQTGVHAGYAVDVHGTLVFDGSPLAEQLASAYPHSSLSVNSRGERLVQSPSPGLGLSELRHHCQAVRSHERRTSVAVERISRYVCDPLILFIAKHAVSIDAQGIVTLGENQI